MKKLIVALAVSVFVVASYSNPSRAQNADESAKSDQALANENAALRKRIQRLELELQNAKLHKRLDQLESASAVASPATGASNPTTSVSKLDAWGSTATVVSPAAGKAYAADLPVKAPALVEASSGGVYLWSGASYQSINLPSYDVGARLGTFCCGGVLLDNGSAQRFDPRPTGYGVSGGLGYAFPGNLPGVFGSNFRIAFGGQYVQAKATQSATANFTASPFIWFTNLAGAFPNLISSCPCSLASRLTTDYDTWQLNGKLATDYRFGRYVLAPSVLLFGGQGRINQQLDQTETALGGNFSYSASTKLTWTEWGAKFGQALTVDLTDWLRPGLAGSVGVADRQVAATGSDTSTGGVVNPSALMANASTTAFLANVEGSLTAHWGLASLSAFGGWNFDSRVPGISSATFLSSGASTILVAAPGIKFESESSYYVGGAGTIKFAP